MTQFAQGREKAKVFLKQNPEIADKLREELRKKIAAGPLSSVAGDEGAEEEAEILAEEA